MKTTILAAVAAIALCSGAQADSSWRCDDARVSPPSHVTAYIRQVYDDLDMKRVAAGLPTSQVTYWKATYDFVMRFCSASGDGANLDETILNAYQAQIGMNRAVDNLGVGGLRP